MCIKVQINEREHNFHSIFTPNNSHCPSFLKQKPPTYEHLNFLDAKPTGGAFASKTFCLFILQMVCNKSEGQREFMGLNGECQLTSYV